MISISDPNFWRKLEELNCVKLIAIVDEDFGVSKNDAIPWSFAEDRRFFKTLTEHFPIIMGRRTFFSIPNIPLINRINCVITKSKNIIDKNIIDNAIVFDSVENALKKYPNAWIIGGAKIYNYSLENNLVDFAVITQVHKKFNADTFINKNLLNKFKKQILFESDAYNITNFLRV